MSVRMLAAVWRSTASSPTHKFVLLALADYANDEGRCWPSVESLATKTQLSPRMVYKALAALQETGEIHVTRRPGHSSIYTVNPCTSFTPAQGSPLNDVHPTPAPRSGVPLNHVHPTPAQGSPRTIHEPSIEPPREPSRELSNTKGKADRRGESSGGDGHGMVRKLLAEAGVRGPNLNRLAEHPDLTPEVVSDELARVRAAADVRCVPAVLTAMLARRVGIELKGKAVTPEVSAVVARIEAMQRQTRGEPR